MILTARRVTKKYEIEKNRQIKIQYPILSLFLRYKFLFAKKKRQKKKKRKLYAGLAFTIFTDASPHQYPALLTCFPWWFCVYFLSRIRPHSLQKLPQKTFSLSFRNFDMPMPKPSFHPSNNKGPSPDVDYSLQFFILFWLNNIIYIVCSCSFIT